MKSVNSNNKSSHVVSNFAAICRDDLRRVCMKSQKSVYGKVK